MRCGRPSATCFARLALALLGGCATVGTLPPVDLSDPGWTVWNAQALWRPAGDRPALAGELIVARHDNGDVLVSFSKPPLPIFTAHSTAGAWKIDFVERGRSHSGRGRPPRRFIWFSLPQILEGRLPPTGWRVESAGEDELELRHRGGEWIRLVLDP